MVAASAGPAYPSLAGDAVDDEDRGDFLARVNSGTLVGSGVGGLIAATALATVGWRWAFAALVVPGLLVARGLARTPDPPRTRPRGGQRHLSYPRVVRLLLARPTPRLVLVAATAANAFLLGVSAFAVVFAVGWYDVSTVQADLALVVLGLGALVGVLLGGWVNDALVRRGRPEERLRVAALASAATPLLWLPGLLLHCLLAALPFLVAGAMALAATLPGLDALRVDVMPPAARGRAEAARTALRALAEVGRPSPSASPATGWPAAGRRGCALPPPTQRTRRRPGSPEGETGGSPT